jgi:hypothetical protein
LEGNVHAIVDLGDVLAKMLAWPVSKASGVWIRDTGRVALRMPGNLRPETPTMLSLPTLPRRRRSKRVKPTTPTFLSEPEAAPPTKPVVYSPVPTCSTLAIAGVSKQCE